MSLRIFHIIFLVSTLFLLSFLCYWNYENWVTEEESISLVYIFISGITGLLITCYGFKFYNKTKGLNE